MLTQALDKAILTHRRWITAIQQDIEYPARLDPIKLGNPHLCEFGCWLKSDEAQQIPSYFYHAITLQHMFFHNEVARLAKFLINNVDPDSKAKMKKQVLAASENLVELLQNAKIT